MTLVASRRIAFKLEKTQHDALPAAPWLKTGRVLLVVLLMAAPLDFGAVQSWAWPVVTTITAVVFFCWGVACAGQRRVTLAASSLWITSALFLLFAGWQLATKTTLDLPSTEEALIKVATDVGIAALAGALFYEASSHEWRWVGLAVTVYTFLLGLFAILQYFSGTDRIYWFVHTRWNSTFVGPYVNHNHYAGLMELLLAFSAGSLLGRRQTAERLALWFGLCVGASSLLLSGSRGGFLSLLLELALFLALVLRNYYRVDPHTVGAILAAAIAGLLFCAWLVPGQVTDRITALLRSPEISYAERRLIAADTGDMLRENWRTGTGLGSFAIAYTRYQTASPQAVIDHAHNDFLEVAAETGVVGIGLVLTGLLQFIVAGWRNCRRKLNDERAWMRAGATIGCCGLLIHSAGDFNLHIPANAAWFSFLLGLSLVQLKGPSAGTDCRETVSP